MSYCVSSFFFLQDYLLPERINMGDVKNKVLKYATDHPMKFTALATFVTLGGVPIFTFLAYSIATIIASLIGAVLLELFLLVVGLAALAFVLFFVSCVTVCVTAVTISLYYGLVAFNTTWKMGKSRYNWSSPTYRHPPDPSRLSEQNDDDEPFDKSKLRGPTLEIGRMSQTFVSSLSSAADLPPKSHDFLRTALVTLFLVSVIFVMFLCVLLTAYIVISFT